MCGRPATTVAGINTSCWRMTAPLLSHPVLQSRYVMTIAAAVAATTTAMATAAAMTTMATASVSPQKPSIAMGVAPALFWGSTPSTASCARSRCRRSMTSEPIVILPTALCLRCRTTTSVSCFVGGGPQMFSPSVVRKTVSSCPRASSTKFAAGTRRRTTRTQATRQTHSK